jgi:hypothetical protein
VIQIYHYYSNLIRRVGSSDHVELTDKDQLIAWDVKRLLRPDDPYSTANTDPVFSAFPRQEINLFHITSPRFFIAGLRGEKFILQLGNLPVFGTFYSGKPCLLPPCWTLYCHSTYIFCTLPNNRPLSADKWNSGSSRCNLTPFFLMLSQW